LPESGTAPNTFSQQLANALTEARTAPLLFVLLCFVYGAYLFAGLIYFFSSEGISEAEEWRIFIIGWPLIPPASVAIVLFIAHLKCTRYADTGSFYLILLAFNALCWIGYCTYNFSPLWLYDYDSGPQALGPLLWLVPLINLCVLFALNRWAPSLVGYREKVAYASLPIAALCVGINFSGFLGPLEPLPFGSFWIQIDPPEGKSGSITRIMEKGAHFHSLISGPLYIEMRSRISGQVRIDLPWNLSTGSRLSAWHFEEEELIEPSQVIAEFESQFLHTTIRARSPIQLIEKKYQLGEEADPTRSLGSYLNPKPNPWILYAALALALIVIPWSPRQTPVPLQIPPVAIDCAILLAIALCILDITPTIDPYHYNYYLGPVNDILNGKTMLVDINCQYGVGIVYFIALIFELLPIPLNYQGFSLVLNILLVAQYALVYLLVRHVLESRPAAITALILALAATYYSQEYTLPSTGPLRFAIPYVLLAILAVRDRNNPRARITVYALIGLAALWSFETFIYTLTTYLCVECYALLRSSHGLRHKLRHLVPLLGGPCITIAFCHLALALFTYLRAGVWPEWDHYFDYIFLYSTKGFGQLPIEAWHPWALYVAVYFLSLILLLYKALSASSNDAGPYPFIAGLTGLGIAQFTYYLGRSHPNNLYHICIPLICLVVFWLVSMQRDTRRVPLAFARSATYCFFAAACLLLISVGSEFATRWPDSAPTMDSPWSAGPSHTEVSEAMSLIAHYAAIEDHIALFLDPDRTTETLMLSRKSHLFPLSHPPQDELLLHHLGQDRVSLYDHGMQAGDHLFFTRDRPSLNGIQLATLSKIYRQFQFLYVDSTKHVYVTRLITPQPAASSQKGQP